MVAITIRSKRRGGAAEGDAVRWPDDVGVDEDDLPRRVSRGRETLLLRQARMAEGQNPQIWMNIYYLFIDDNYYTFAISAINYQI